MFSGFSPHPGQSAFHDVGDFVGEGRVVGNHRRVGGGQQQRVTVGVLQALTGQGGAPGGGPEHEPSSHLVGRGPEAIAGALEAEHRVEDVNGDHRFVVRRIRGAGRDERAHRPGFVDALVQDLPDFALLVGQHQVGVNRGIQLAIAVIDL